MTLQQAVILVGGRGTRLGALTETIPKPLAEVAGRPFLDWQIEETARFGFQRITLLAGYKAEQIVARYDGRRVRGARLEVWVEPAPLGTAGALRLFAERLDPRFLLMNGDTLFAINLLDLPLHSAGATATLALKRSAPGGRYGVVDVDEGGTIRGFGGAAAGGPINGGIYVVDRGIVGEIERGRSVSLEGEVFPRLAARGALRGAIYEAPFLDIGVPADLARAQTEIPAMVRRPAAVIEGAADCAAVKRLNDAGWYVFVASEASLVETNAALAARGAHVDAVAPRGQTEALLAAWPIEGLQAVRASGE